MDKNIERILQSPMMKLANENQARLDSLSLASGSTDKLLKIAQDLNPAKRWAGRIATQDLLSQFSQDFPQSNLGVDKSIAGIIKSLAELNSINKSLFESIKLNTALIDAFEATHLGLKPATQFILPKSFTSKNQIGDLSSIISEATEIFKQHDKFRKLGSFKAISSLKNFPFEDVVRNNFDYFTELKESSDETILELDLEISERLSLVDDFNDLSVEDQSFILNSYRICYYPIILNCLIILLWLKDFLDEKLDLTNNTFIFVERSKVKLSYISNIYRPNPSAIIDNVVAGGALMLLAKILGW